MSQTGKTLILYILPTISLLFGAVAGAELRILLGIGETAAAILFDFDELRRAIACAITQQNAKMG